MSNYRGGERGISSYGAENINAIKKQTTERQIKRNQLKKTIMGLSQAGLMGLSGLVKGGESSFAEQDANRKRDTMQTAIAKAKQARDYQYANSPVPDYKPMVDGPGDAQVPWSRDAGGDAVSPYQDLARSAMDDAVAKGRAAMKTNDAASMAPVDGQYTPQGQDDLNAEAQTGAEDLNRSKDLIGIGGGTGLGGSMKTWGDGP